MSWCSLDIKPIPPSIENRKDIYILLKKKLEDKIKFLQESIQNIEIKYYDLCNDCINSNKHFNLWIKKLQNDNVKLQDDNVKLQDDNVKLRNLLNQK